MLFIGDDWTEIITTSRLSVRTVVVWPGPGYRRGSRASLGCTRWSLKHAPTSWTEPPDHEAAAQVVVGIETDRGPWVTALRAAGYQVLAINPMSAARYR